MFRVQLINFLFESGKKGDRSCHTLTNPNCFVWCAFSNLNLNCTQAGVHQKFDGHQRIPFGCGTQTVGLLVFLDWNSIRCFEVVAKSKYVAWLCTEAEVLWNCRRKMSRISDFFILLLVYVWLQLICTNGLIRISYELYCTGIRLIWLICS